MANVKEIKMELSGNKFPISDQEIPSLTARDYQERINRLLQLAGERKLTHLIVYGDREHFANIHFLTGYDPRFEETLLILSQDNLPLLLVGNEGWSYSRIIPFPINRELFQSFSLVGQPRGNSRKLAEIFSVAGIKNSSQIGVIGWKSFSRADTVDYRYWVEIPAYIIETLTQAVKRENILNANDFMIHNEYGLRINLDVKELIRLEIAGTMVSRKVFNVINNLRPGISEMEASANLNIDGYPIATHPNINFGADNVSLGLASPTFTRKLAIGDPISIGFGYWGALVHRASLYANSAEDIPAELRSRTILFFKKYFETMAVWYESLQIGISGGAIYNEVKKAAGGLDELGIVLNPGHLIHTDEWTNSPFFESSEHKLFSGMGIQCDFFAAKNNPYIGAHVEDGVLLADSVMREKIKKLFPASWSRIIKRRELMKNILGINLAAEVLPTSDIQGMLFPYMANPKIVLSKL
jgi:hypothetical protein